MPRCEGLSSPPIQDQDGDIWALIHTVMDFTGAPERLQSSFGLLRMSHLSAARLLPPLSSSLSHSLLPLVRPRFFYSFPSIALLFLNTAHVQRALPRLITRA